MKFDTLEKNKRSRGRPKTIGYDATLKIAMHAYWSKGIDGMSVNEICRLAGVSKPSLYREFGNEDALLSTVIKYYGVELHENLTALLNRHKTFSENLNGLIDFASFTRDQSILPKGCLAAKGFQAFERLGKKSRMELEALSHDSLNIFNQWVSEFRKEISLGIDWCESQIGEYIFSIFTHGMIMNDQGKNPEKIKRIMSLALSPLVIKI